jgi:hypothetical protein
LIKNARRRCRRLVRTIGAVLSKSLFHHSRKQMTRRRRRMFLQRTVMRRT